MTMRYLEHHLPLADHQYAVIDRMRVPEFPENWPLIELISPMLAPQAHLYPWLLPLHDIQSGDWRKLMAELSQHSDPNSPSECCLLLNSTHTPQAMRNALVAAMYLTDKQHKGHILRFYDPRVLFHLHWMLTPWQLFNQLSALEIPRWTFWLEGSWHTLEFPEHIPSQPGGTVSLQLDQLQRIGQINLALAKLPHSKDILQRQEMSRRIDALLVHALQCQLPTQEDRIAFVLHGLTQCEAFWTAPKMAALLIQARQFPDFYRDETSDWDEKRWLEMTQMQPRNNKWSY